MKEDRFLTGILIGIVLLVVASLSVFFLRKDSQTYLPEDSPDAIVHNYIFALQQEDYERAYTYLADEENKPSYTVFLLDVGNSSDYGVQIDDVEISNETASVNLLYISPNGDLFAGRYEHEGNALLVKQDNTWKMLSMSDYYFWSWGWYQEE